MAKIASRCTTCIKSTRPGLLWLGGGDWLECPDCGGTTIIEAVAEIFTPKERITTIGGGYSFVERRHHPAIAHLQDAYECRSTG